MPHRAATSHRLASSRLLVPILVLLCVALPAGAEETLESVSRMLRAGISEAVLLDWLQDAPPPAKRLGAEQLIELQTLGASDAVLRRLLELSRQGGEAFAAEPKAESPPPSAPEPKTPSRPPAAEPKAPSGPPSAPPVTEARIAPPPPTGAEARVRFTLRYAPEYEEDSEEWDLFLYLDSRPLTLVPAASNIFSRKALEFERSFSPGLHRLEVVLERHARRGPSTWFHAARAAGVGLPLDLAPGSVTEVELSFSERHLGFSGGGGPLSYRALRGDEVLELRERFGGDPDDWRPICEEIESNRKPGKKLPRSQRRELESCVAWKDLWPDVAEPMPRATVREKLALFGYRPVPKEAR